MAIEYLTNEPVALVGTGRVACAIGRQLRLRGELAVAVAGHSPGLRLSKCGSTAGEGSRISGWIYLWHIGSFRYD